ncbi:unnamed protein product [Oikopleura dioica]|uniref:Uncharacterized protein n=1 Tax=Oikopleura dioica TaxID=34765 RepID=E4XD04_OIKDI|nr:unnamed protein product [Oikopleura dioica]
MDFNLARVDFGSNERQNFSKFFYKITLQPGTAKLDKLSTSVLEPSHISSSFCIVPFHGDYFIIQEEVLAIDSFKLTHYKINQAGIIEKLSEDFTKISLGFVRNSKICSRGLYQNKEERIIARPLRSEKIRRILNPGHSYVIKDNRVFLTEIYNRPHSTLFIPGDTDRVIGLTLNNQLVCLKKCDTSLTNFQTTIKMANFYHSI